MQLIALIIVSYKNKFDSFEYFDMRLKLFLIQRRGYPNKQKFAILHIYARSDLIFNLNNNNVNVKNIKKISNFLALHSNLHDNLVGICAKM